MGRAIRLKKRSYSQILLTRHITSSSYRNHACNEWKHLYSVKIKQFMIRTMQFQKRFLKRVAMPMTTWKAYSENCNYIYSLIIMTKWFFSKLMISYIYIFSQQLYSHACIPSADGPIITLFVVGVFWGGGGSYVWIIRCSILSFLRTVFFNLLLAFLSLFILTIVLYVNPSSNYGCELTPLVSPNFCSPLFQVRAFPFINTYKQKYKTVHGDKT